MRRILPLLLIFMASARAEDWEDQASWLLQAGSEDEVIAGVELCVQNDSERAARLLCRVLAGLPQSDLDDLRDDYAASVDAGNAPIGLGYTEQELERRPFRMRGPQDGGQSVKLALSINAHMALEREICAGLAGLRSSEATLWLQTKGLEHKSWKVRCEVAAALGKIAAQSSVPLLEAALEDRKWPVQLMAAEALAQLGARETAGSLEALLDHKQWQVRLTAVEALTRLQALPSVARLIDCLEIESGRLHSELESALRSLTGESIGGDARLWRDWLAVHGPALADGSYRKPSGQHATVPRAFGTFFGIPVDSEQVLFVIDFSKSMQRGFPRLPVEERVATGEDGEDPHPELQVAGETRIAEAQEQTLRVLAALPRSADFGVMVYHWGVEMLTDGMVAAKARTVERTAGELLEQPLGLGTNIFDALERAYDLTGTGKLEKNARMPVDTIYFLSDGSPTSGRYAKHAKILEQVKHWNRLRKLRIHTVLIRDVEDTGPRQADRFMLQLAALTGGQFVDAGDDLEAAPGGQAQPRPGAEDMIGRFDTDGDGRLSREEVPPRVARRFEQADTNRDGWLDAGEAAALLAQRPR